MADMTAEDARESARRMTDVAIRTAYPDATGRLRDLEVVAYASAQAHRHAQSDRFGPDDPLVAAYREVAEEAAMSAYAHTQRILDERLASETSA